MAPASRTVLLACVAVALSLAPQQQPGLRCSPLVAASAREEAKHAWRAKLAASAAEDAANRAWALIARTVLGEDGGGEEPEKVEL